MSRNLVLHIRLTALIALCAGAWGMMSPAQAACIGFYQEDPMQPGMTQYGDIDCVIATLQNMGFSADSSNLDPIPQHAYAEEGDTFAIDTSGMTLTEDDISLCNHYDFTCSINAPSSISAQARCVGNNNNGGWQVNQSSTGSCWKTLEICQYDNWGGGWQICVDIDENGTTLKNSPYSNYAFSDQYKAPSAAITLAPFKNSNYYAASYSKCGFENGMGTHRPDTHKEYCIWEGNNYFQAANTYTQYTPTEGRFANDTDSDFSGMGQANGMTGQTGDDMFALGRGADLFFEYIDISNDISTPNRLIHLERSNGGENLDLMVPAGPRNDFRDYFDFINNPPPSVSITDACYPVQAVPSCNVAGDTPYIPPMRCGSAPSAGTCSKPETMSVSIATSGKPTATGTLYKAAVFQYSDGNDLSGRTLNGSVSIGSDVRNNILSCSISSGCCTTSSSFTDSEGYSFTTQMHASVNADNDIEATISMTCTPPPSVNGVCGNANGNTYDWGYFSSAGPEGSQRCHSGGDNDMNWTGNAAEGGTYTWFCAGLYGGQNSATCSATISPEESPPECGTARNSDNYFSPYRNNGTTYSGTPPTGTEACGNGSQENLTFYNQNWSWRWDCVNNSGASTSCEVLSPCYESGYDPSFMGDCQLPEPVDPGAWTNIDNFGCSDDNEHGTNDCPRMEEDIADAGYDTLDSCPGYSDPDGDSCWNYGEKCMYDYDYSYGAGGDAFVDVTRVEIFECQ